MLVRYVCERCGTPLDALWLDAAHEEVDGLRRVGTVFQGEMDIATLCGRCLDLEEFATLDRGGD